jgi:hypothetical protein
MEMISHKPKETPTIWRLLRHGVRAIVSSCILLFAGVVSVARFGGSTVFVHASVAVDVSFVSSPTEIGCTVRYFGGFEMPLVEVDLFDNVMRDTQIGNGYATDYVPCAFETWYHPRDVGLTVCFRMWFAVTCFCLIGFTHLLLAAYFRRHVRQESVMCRIVVR